MKKLFLLMPLAFLALTGCTSGEANKDSGNNENTGSQVETNTGSEHSEDQGGQPAASIDTLTLVDAPENNKEYYVCYDRGTDATSKKGDFVAKAGRYALTGALDSGKYYKSTQDIASAVKVKTVKSGENWTVQFLSGENANKYFGAHVVQEENRDGSMGDKIRVFASADPIELTYNTAEKTFTQAGLTYKNAAAEAAFGVKKDSTWPTVGAYNYTEYGFSGNWCVHLYK